jgi:hypothetical protein
MPKHPTHRLPAPLIACTALAAALLIAACGGNPTAEPTAEPTAAIEPTVAAAPTEAAAEVTLLLVAKDLVVEAGTCTTLEWESTNARQVYLDGRGVDATGSEEVCPTETTVYTLSAIDAAGTESTTEASVEVTAPAATVAPTLPPQPTRPPVTAAPTVVPATAAPTAAPTAATSIEFWSDRRELDEETSCTNIRWRTSGVKEVYLERDSGGPKAVGGEGEQKDICIGRGEKVRFTLIVKHLDGREEKREVTIEREN